MGNGPLQGLIDSDSLDRVPEDWRHTKDRQRNTDIRDL
jgi:hypothetical protein